MSALSMGSVVKGAGASKDYHVDFSPFLAAAEKVVGAVYAQDPIGITIGSGAYASTIDDDGKGGTVWLQGGTPGIDYVITATFTTDNVPPRIEQRTFTVVIENTGNAAVEERGWIDVVRDFGADYTGAQDTYEAFQLAIDAAKFGGVVRVPYGHYRLNTGLFLDFGVTMKGDGEGWKLGDRVFVDVPQTRATFDIYDTVNPGITVWQDATLSQFNFYYPNQNGAASTPTVYPASVKVTGLGAAVEGLAGINPYWFIDWETNGGKASNITGYPLKWGFWCGRNGGGASFSDINFTPVVWGTELGATLQAWVQANAVAYVMDGGAEEISWDKILCYGYDVGLLSQAFNASAIGSAGNLTNALFDTVNVGILVVSGLNFVGLRADNVAMAINATGAGIKFSDSGGAGYFSRPRLAGSRLQIRGVPGVGRSIWMVAGSRGFVEVDSSYLDDVTAPTAHVFADSATSEVHLSRVIIPTGGVRTAGAGTITDTQQRTV